MPEIRGVLTPPQTQPREVVTIHCWRRRLPRAVARSKYGGLNLPRGLGQYPEETILPGKDSQAWLECYIWECAPDRYPEGLPPDVLKTVRRKLDLIRTKNYARFRKVSSIVRLAKCYCIHCQGGELGTAASSAVCQIPAAAE